MDEALDLLAEQGIVLDVLRVRGFPFHDDVAAFIAAHDQVFVVEQNRDAQFRTLLINEIEIDPRAAVPVLHYDGYADHRSLYRRRDRRAAAAPTVDAVRKAAP